MSTIARAGSAPEPSSSPLRTVVGGRLRAGLAGDEALARLARVGQQDDLQLRRRSTVPSAPTRTGWPLRPSTVSPVAVVSAPSGGGAEAAVARVLHAVGALHGEEALACDREVERLVGAGAIGCGRQSVAWRSMATPWPSAPICAPVCGVLQQHLLEGALGRAVGLVARGRGVGEVVGDQVLTRLLGDHARRGDVEATLHARRVIGARCAILEGRWTPSSSTRSCCAEPAAGPPADAGRDVRRPGHGAPRRATGC